MRAHSHTSIFVFALVFVTAIFVSGANSSAQTPLKLKPRAPSAGELPGVAAPRTNKSSGVASPRQTTPAKTPVLSGPPNKRLQELDRALDAARGKSNVLKDKANMLDVDIQRLRQGLVSAARLIQDHEVRVSALTEQLAELTASLTEKEKKLNARRKQMGRVLLALHRVAQYPPEALIVRPIPPGDAVRSAILLRATVPELERQAITLRDDLFALKQAQEEAKRRQEELSSATQELGSQRKLLRTLLGRKSRLRRRTLAKSNEAERKVRDLTKQARSIRDLMVRLETLRLKREKEEKAQKNKKTAVRVPPNLKRPKAFTGKPMETAEGRLLYPVVGPVVARFGEKAQGGLSHKGLTIVAKSGAQVIAPYEGRVAFSGPFRGYGELLIIEHREGYHTLLAGMSRIDGVVGQWLLAGEPVGVMGANPAGKKNEKPALYIEMRYKGQPINPLPWLATRKGKADKRKVNG